ncbi:MAG TPA: hypothetical protein VJ964_00825 [Balneolaceae bacterium]|nr:hypothetical protein [Balneolaceae bacterium]
MDRISTHNSFSLIKRLQQDGPARLVSDLINPLILPPAVIGLTCWLMGLMAGTVGWIMGVSVFFYTLAPFAATFYLLSKNYISSLDLPERTSRNRLFVISIGCAAIVFACFSLTIGSAPWIIAAISFVFLVNPLVGFLVNFFWKMSIHTAALSSAGAIFLFLAKFDLLPVLSDAYILSLTILLLLLPLMIWARYRLSIHTLGELFGGALAGFLLTILELSLLINLW